MKTFYYNGLITTSSLTGKGFLVPGQTSPTTNVFKNYTQRVSKFIHFQIEKSKIFYKHEAFLQRELKTPSLFCQQIEALWGFEGRTVGHADQPPHPSQPQALFVSGTTQVLTSASSFTGNSICWFSDKVNNIITRAIIGRLVLVVSLF